MFREEVLGVVLAGGASRRMGFDKGAIELDGRSLVERALGVLHELCAEVVVSTQPGSGAGGASVETMPDLRSHAGPLAGLEAALSREAGSGRPVFLLACDLPYVGTEAVAHILDAAQRSRGSSAVVPALKGRIQPLCGLYRPGCLAAVREHLDAGRRAMRELVEAVPAEKVVIDETHSFFRPDLFHNLNQPADLDSLSETSTS